MTIDACAALVERGDPDRFAAVMAAPVAARARLFPLYAFNLEVARAPWVTAEPMIAEMRLQWWRDVIAAAGSGAARAHEVAGPLHELIRDRQLPPEVLDRLVAARRWDVWSEPFDGMEAFETYLEDTGGGLMWLAARALDAPDRAEGAARDLGRALAMANFLAASAALAARGRVPLVDASDAAVRAMAARGLGWLAAARKARAALGPALPATHAAFGAGALLAQASRDPGRVVAGRLALSEFARRGRLLWTAATGRW
ncbi:MAG: squalene/phytoene synthase family protein [Paracoccaceae bacterium]|nr:MAG: squalene/phytoene synthase family protein [Paracoccaceae bacterium]